MLIPVQSSLISTVLYDKDNKTLHVQFKDGTINKYAEVDSNTVQKLLTSKSIGKYFKEHIHGKHKKL